MRRISRMILVTACYNFRMWKKNMRVIAAFLLAFILCFMLTDKLVLFAGEQETTMQLVSRLYGRLVMAILFCLGPCYFYCCSVTFPLLRQQRRFS